MNAFTPETHFLKRFQSLWQPVVDAAFPESETAQHEALLDLTHLGATWPSLLNDLLLEEDHV